MEINNSKIYLGNSFIKKIYIGNYLVKYNYPTSIKINGLYLNNTLSSTQETGKTYKIDITVSPITAFDKSFTISCNSNNAEISNSNSTIKFNSAGNFTITAKTNFNNCINTYNVTVITLPTGITLDSNVYNSSGTTISNVLINTWYYLSSTVYPTNATNKTVTYSCNNGNVQISGNTVKATSAGTYTIIASTYNGLTNSKSIAFKNPEILPTGITLDSSLYNSSGSVISNILINTSYYLKATISPNNATNKTITYSCNNGNVQISGNTVKATSAGTYTITAKTYNNISDSKNITFNNPEILPTGVWLSPNIYDSSGYLDDSNLTNTWYYLQYEVTPSNATNKTVTLSSNSSNLIVSNSDYSIKATSAGTYTITIKTWNNFTDTLTITFKNPEILPNGLTVSSWLYTNSSLTQVAQHPVPNTWYYISASVTPSNATNKTITLSCNSNNLTVDNSDCSIKASAPGTYTIRISAVSTYLDKDFTIEAAEVLPTSIYLSGDLYISNGGSTIASDLKTGVWYWLKATVYPSNATNKTVTLSSNSSDLTVDNSDCSVKAFSAGTYKITASTFNGYTDYVYKTFNAPATVPTSITINSVVRYNTSTSYSQLEKDLWYQLNYTIYPSNATDQTISISISGSSSNYTIDTSDNSFKFSNSGSYTITARTNSGGCSDSYTITVKSSSSSNPVISSSYPDEVIALAKTYYDVRDTSITYNQTNIMSNISTGTKSWSDVITYGTDGTYRHLDCSGLVGLCIRGISYNAAYGSQSNYESIRNNLTAKTDLYSWAFTLSRTAQLQYNDCNSKGWIISSSSWSYNGSGINKGDLIFYGNSTSTIKHVALCYGYNNAGKKAIIESTSSSYVSKHTDTAYNKGICIITFETLLSKNSTKYYNIIAVARPQ